MADPTTNELGDEGSLVLEQRFAIVPEWVIDADISDCAYRLYSVLLRYGQSSGQRMPARATLAGRLRKKSTDTIDRALKELTALGAVTVEHRLRDGRQLTNRYHLMSTRPTADGVSTGSEGRISAAPNPGRGRIAAAPSVPRGRILAAPNSRTAAAPPAAQMRPDPGVPTQSPPPSGSPASPASFDGRAGLAPGDAVLLAACGIANLDQLATECQRLRRGLGKPQARWSGDRLLDVLREAVSVRGWPAPLAARALRMLAADPATLGPMRLPCPGPWWDTAEQHRPQPPNDPALAAEQQTLEARLLEAGGSRVWAQQQARAQLADRGEPVTRLTVSRLACQLLDQAELAPC